MANSADKLASHFRSFLASPPRQAGAGAWVLAGSRLSPETLKTEALLRASPLPWVRLYDGPGLRLRLSAYLRRQLLALGLLATPAPVIQPVDEAPLGPFLYSGKGEYVFDSTAIGLWLTDLASPSLRHPLVPKDPAARLLCLLIDEAADEWLGCLAFHQRWAREPPELLPLLSREWPHLPLGALKWLARHITDNRSRERPFYLSVSRDWAERHPGFVPTEALLEQALQTWMRAMETALGQGQPWLLGPRFSLADASCFGQLAACAQAPRFAAMLSRDYPALNQWCRRILDGDTRPATPSESAVPAPERLQPLLAEICSTFVPLMQQNTAAWRWHLMDGRTRFDRTSFKKSTSLYELRLKGATLRAGIKAPQAHAWSQLRARWDGLSEDRRTALQGWLPHRHGLDSDLGGYDGGLPARYNLQLPT